MLDLSEKKTNQKLVYSSNSLLKSNNDFKRSNKKKNSYKEQALEKINLSPLQSKLKYPNNKMTFSKEKYENIFDDDDSLNNIKMLKTIDPENSRKKKLISFADDVNFNTRNNNLDLNDSSSLSCKKSNIYVNDEIKDNIIQKALIRHNSSKNNIKKEKEENENNLKENKNENEEENEEEEMKKILLRNKKKINKINSIKIENDEIENLSLKNEEEEENEESIITIIKDNFPYKKYELSISRNDINKSMSHKKSFEYENDNKLNIEDLNIEFSKYERKHFKSKTINLNNKKVNINDYSIISNNDNLNNKYLIKRRKNNRSKTFIPSKKYLNYIKEEFFKNRRAKLILEKLSYPNNSNIAKSGIENSFSSSISDIIRENLKNPISDDSTKFFSNSKKNNSSNKYNNNSNKGYKEQNKNKQFNQNEVNETLKKKLN